jgi:hypothetical protein
MRIRLLAWAAMVLALVIPAVAQKNVGPEGESAPPPKGGAIWRHENTGFMLPQRLGDMEMEEIHTYPLEKHGMSVRYVNDKLRARADIYLYPCARPHSNLDEISQSLQDEASAVLAELELVRQQGTYSSVLHDKATIKEIELRDGTKTSHLVLPIRYTINDDRGAGTVPTKVESLLMLVVYRDHWVKVRYTFPSDSGKEGEEACNDYASKVLKCVLASDLRKELEEWIVTYRKDPLSKEAVDKGGGVVAYADALPVVHLRIGPALTTFGEACTKQVPDATLDVLRAFVVGVTDATLKGCTQSEVVAAGVQEVSLLCDLWKKKDPKFTPPSLQDFGAAVAKENKVTLPSEKAGGNPLIK